MAESDTSSLVDSNLQPVTTITDGEIYKYITTTVTTPDPPEPPVVTTPSTAENQELEIDLLTAISAKLPSSLGSKTTAESFSITFASDQAAIPVTGSFSATNPSITTIGSSVPGSATYIGGLDSSGNLRGLRTFDADSGAGTQNVLGVNLRKSASGGSVEFGTSTDPIRIDPTGTTTQPISAASLPLPTDAATETTLLALNGKFNSLGQKTSAGSVSVVLSSDSAAVGNDSVSSIGAAIPGSSTLIGGSDGTNLQAVRVFDYDSGGGTQYILGVGLRKSSSGGSVEIGTSSDPIRIDPTGSTTQPISAVSLPLPSGAATESTLSALNAKFSSLGQKASVASAPVVIASDQSRLPISSEVQIDYDSGAGTQSLSVFGFGLPGSGGAVAGGTSTNPIRIDTTGTTTQPISAVSLPLPSGAATETTLATLLTSSTFTARLNTLGQKTSANSAPVVFASDQSSLTTSNASIGVNNSAIPTSSTQIGGSDGTNLQVARVFDGDTGGGSQYVLGAILRKSASGGTVEAGTATDPLRIDPTGSTTQPISAASLPLPSGAASETTLSALNGKFGSLGQKNMAGSAPVVLASDQAAIPVTISPATSSTATLSVVSASLSSQQFLAANSDRKKAIFQNDSAIATIYLKLGTTASTSSYTVKMLPGSYYELPEPIYLGRIDGIFTTVSGDVKITELT